MDILDIIMVHTVVIREHINTHCAPGIISSVHRRNDRTIIIHVDCERGPYELEFRKIKADVIMINDNIYTYGKDGWAHLCRI